MNADDTITVTLDATVIGRLRDRYLAVEFAWSGADPLCVTMDFGTRPVWNVARDVLVAGLVGPAGIGGVTVCPHADDPRFVALSLSSPDGHAVLLLDRVDLDGFIAATEHRVRIGAEQIVVPDFVPADIPEV